MNISNAKFLNNIGKILFYFIPFLLLINYILLSFHNVYQNDDLTFSVDVNKEGLLKLWWIYFHWWETNFNSLIMFFLTKYVRFIPPYIFNNFILLINILSFKFLLNSIQKKYHIDFTSFVSLLLSSLLITITYFSCSAQGNATYWVVGQICYCLFLSYLFLGIYFWINNKILLASLFMFLFSHTRINYDAIFIGLFSVFFINKLYNWKLKSGKIDYKQLLPFGAFVIGLILYLLIPGNYKRAELYNSSQETTLSIFKMLFLVVKATQDFVINFFSNWKQLIVLPIGVLFGMGFKNDKIKKVLNRSSLIWCSFAMVIAFIGQAMVLILSIKTTHYSPRIYFFYEFLFFVLLFLFGLRLGISLSKLISDYISNSLVVLMTAILSFFILKDLINNFKIVSEFSIAYNKRIEMLIKYKHQKRSEAVYLEPLPDSGPLKFMEIKPLKPGQISASDIDAYVNYYELPFKIYIRQ